MKRIRITKAMLEAHGACSVEVEVFAHTWPKGAVVSLVNLRRAAELGLDLGWFAAGFLTGSAKKEFYAGTAPATRAYSKETAPSLRVYKAAVASEEHQVARVSAWRVYYAETRPAWQVFCAARAAVLWKVIQAHGLRGVEPS